VTQEAAQPPWTIEAIVRWATDDFRGRGIDSPRLDAELLLAHALGATRMQLIVDSKRPLSPPELARFRELVKRRRVREPVAYLLGEREFYGRKFRVDKRVLVPRPDTETLVEVALKRTRARSMSMRALDICTGSGCVATTLGRERVTAHVLATDLSDDALAVARDNALRLGAYNVAFKRADLFAGLGKGPFDVITANPPYIPSAEIATLDADVRNFEPRGALDGGADGLDLVRRVVDGARALLDDGGILAVEIGSGQAGEARACFERSGYVEVETARDYAKIERVVSGAHRKTSR
jgi:release factor glutamine methyltransferase